MEDIFPPEYRPPNKEALQYQIITFGSNSDLSDPNKSGFAFFFIAGSDTLVSSMTKRDNPGLHFLDCPNGPLEVPVETQQTARIVCLSGSLDECFGVQKNGVEGTIVHMPEECGSGTYARAISLRPSNDQEMPLEIFEQGAVSPVYDFVFDYNMGLVRRDAGDVSIRIDYSNVPGYWDAVVRGKAAAEKRLERTVKRFWSSQPSHWFDQFKNVKTDTESKDGRVPKQDLTKLLYYDGQKCSSLRDEAHGLAIAITGETDVRFFHGFSLIATWNPAAGNVDVHQAAGFLQVAGETQAYFTVAGIGEMRIRELYAHRGLKHLWEGHSIFHGWASFTKFSQQEAYLNAESDQESYVHMNGWMQARVKA